MPKAPFVPLEILRLQAAEQYGMALVPIERIKTLTINQVVSDDIPIPNEFLEKEIHSRLVHELSDKLREFKKYTALVHTHPYLQGASLVHRITCTLKVIVP